MNLNYKNILLGIVIGVIGTCGVFFFVGDVDIETKIQIGEKGNKDNKDIDIRIEKTIDGDEEITNVIATGSGSVTEDDLDKALERLFSEHNINKSSENVKIEKKITD